MLVYVLENKKKKERKKRMKEQNEYRFEISRKIRENRWQRFLIEDDFLLLL
jgi:hypothetical protein